MKRILAFMLINFRVVRGYNDKVRAKLKRDVQFEVKQQEGEYYLYLLIFKLGRFKLKEPILIIKSKKEDEILEKWTQILINQKVFGRLLNDNLNLFEEKSESKV